MLFFSPTDNYTCSDGIGKIPVERKCDGEPDCADDSDETHCGMM